MLSRARVLALVAALVVVVGVVMGTKSALAARPRCAALPARAELSCARHELRLARRELRQIRLRYDRRDLAGRPSHSAGYWRWRERVDRAWIRSARSQLGSVPAIICRVFGAARCPTALAIAKRESGFSTNPQPPNPTHFGIFQLDQSALNAYARGRYRTAYDQIKAAFRMFLARGWEPWTCCEG